MKLVLSLLSMAAMLAMVSATAMTTPFVQNGECVSAMVLTTITTSFYSTSTTITVLASDAAAPAFSSCQPSGWDRDAGREDMLSFSPAVCPSNWTYYEMSTKKHYSTAYCCANGFTFGVATDSLPTLALSPACGRTINPGDTTITATLASRTQDTGTFTGGLIVHRAWHVSWADSDTSTMSPSLPPLTSGKYLSQWVPGQFVPPGAYDHHNGNNSGVRGWDALLYFAMIGVPIIGVVLIAGIVSCVVCRRKKRRRAQRAQGSSGTGTQ